jgi:hypothetical protein
MLLFFVGVYNVYLFCYMSHGEGTLSELSVSLDTREHLLVFLHFFPCFGLVFFLNLLFV